MDPVSQAVLGAAAAQAAFGRRLPRSAWWIGGLTGLAADLDVFINVADPMHSLLLHRHFTHALAFVPTGGLLCAAVVMWHRAFAGSRHTVLAAAMLAYLTHPLLDACTSYGTSLFWPVSDARVAWDIVSVIDPLYTLPLLVGVIWAAIARSPRPAAVALAVSCLYLGFGFVQHERAAAEQRRLADERGHEVVRARVMPTLGNLVLWRSLYEADGRLWADAVRVAPLGGTQVREGSSVPRVDLAIQTGDPETDLAVYRYHLFTQGWTARLPGPPERRDVVADMRYSRDPAGFDAIWGAQVGTHTLIPVGLESSRDNLGPDLLERLREVWNGFEETTPTN